VVIPAFIFSRSGVSSSIRRNTSYPIPFFFGMIL